MHKTQTAIKFEFPEGKRKKMGELYTGKFDAVMERTRIELEQLGALNIDIKTYELNVEEVWEGNGPLDGTIEESLEDKSVTQKAIDAFKTHGITEGLGTPTDNTWRT